jgi:site-specific DNA-methyltransferase (adenine-specific)
MDCLEGMKYIKDKSIDMILCDLPYGTTQNKWDSIIPLDKLWQQYERIIKDNGSIVLFSQTPFDKVLGCSNLKLLKYEWIYKKSRPTGHLNSKKMPMKEHENILVFYKKQPTYNYDLFLKDLDKPIYRNSKWRTNNGNYGDIDKDTIQTKTGYIRDIIEFLSVGTHRNLHPTQKPVELCEFLINIYTQEGDLVLDNCIGSGTTAIACLNTNRNYIGFELDTTYCGLANKRIQDIVCNTQ